MAGKFDPQRQNNVLALGSSATKYDAGDLPLTLPINVKAVVFDDVGTMNFKNAADGTEITGYPVRAGPAEFVPVVITAIDGPANFFLVS